MSKGDGGVMEKEREIAIMILQAFENKLEELNVSLPDKERAGMSEEARIYGQTYYELEDLITNILKEVGV